MGFVNHFIYLILCGIFRIIMKLVIRIANLLLLIFALNALVLMLIYYLFFI